MKTKIAIITVCLGIFFWINDNANAQTTKMCGDGGVCTAVEAPVGLCPSNKTEITVPAGTCSANQKCCKTADAVATPVPVACSGECIPSVSCSTDKNEIDSKATDCRGGAVCCVAKASATSTAAATTPPQTIEFTNPITPTTLEGLLGNLMTALQGVVALIAIIMIVVGGLMYMFAGVDEKMVETAKKTIGGAIIGLAIVFAAPAFLKEILIIVDGTDKSGLLAGAPSIKDIAEKILNLLLSIVGILGIIGLVIGGGFYMTAYGDEDRIKKGKGIITASMFGIIIAAAALIIVRQIANLFG